ncbi:SPOR domain-containing protein [Aureimonas flava]|uniref:SPOR domain-containing protein n=1 Tax=Aureimonas flava TaxID=2320271 RepID=A0A3A1WXH9_9HYPH|nr:SPOR domain-containing protein [Aureimonas flava]RIY03429.1 SPOR domain-containing protein [Aureimonas flava]
MKDAKGFGGRGAVEGGRYAEVSRDVDPPMTSGRGQASAYGGFEPVEVRSDDWESFTYQPSAAAPQPPAAAAVLAAPRTAAPGALPRGIRGSGDADRQIDEALLGLSMPARPRNTNPAETQSFAPARDSEFDLEPRQPITLDDFDELINSELAAMRGAPAETAPQADDDYALGYDDADAEADYEPYDDYPVRTRSRLRGVMLMGGVAVVAIVAVAGAATMLTGGTTQGDGSMLIKADAEPYKIAPVDPGGKTIPNQNKAVYQKVAGETTATTAPKQDSLVTAMEEPIDIAEEEDAPVDSLPGVEVGEQIPLPGEEPVRQAEAAKDSTDGTLQPRKVRTLSVRPDGTLVENEMPAEGGALLTAASSMQTHAATLDPVAGISPQMPFGQDEPDMTTASTAAQAPEPVAAAPTPEPEPQRVAALEAPAPEGSFFVQIASQPSQAAAQESLANMGKRYSSVIGGRSLGIKAAEIPGKGTFYRVRVAAGSRSEANTLCENLKSAGGSCFVTR